MIRKYTFILTAIASAALALTSCESFLDKAPDENLTVDDIFANRLYTIDFLTHTYSWIPTEANMADDGGAWRNPYTAGCDEMECAYGGAYGHLINNGSWNSTNINQTQIWGESYMALRKVNMMLERVDGVPASEDEIRHWKGECHFLRAFFHFLAFRAFGAIPIADRCYDPKEDLMSIRRSPADSVANFIARECDLAAEYLYDEDKWPSTDTGRATRLSALGLKSRVLLYIASPLYNGNKQQAELKDPIDGTNLINQTYDAEKWKRAADASLKCIDMCKAAGRALYNKYPDNPVKNYASIFTDCWNDEILWAKNIGTYVHWLNCADPVSFGWFSIFNPTQEMVDAYEMEDGSTPITGYTNDGLTPIINKESGYVEEGFIETADESGMARWQAGVCNMYTHREPRFYASINFAGAIWKWNAPNYNFNDPHTLEFWYKGCDGKGVAGSDYCKTGYLLRKLVHPDRVPNGYIPNQQWVYLRLGEVYLNYAEALNEYSGPTAEVYAAVDAIRNRAGLPGLPKGLTKEQMRDKIKHERRIELAFEVHRFFDVRRWLDAENTESKPIHSMDIYAGEHMQDPAFYRRVKVEDRVFEAPKHYFLPIYQVEIDKHQRKELVQNLGWTAVQ
ncbi:MAG: RagB/SusD family nutrient uptake outer membrane protein [Bacteroidales bacterium]|nr:RagB/SusD family nutrient uptake outer membrane protein [Bacteroidales bacterium]